MYCLLVIHRYTEAVLLVPKNNAYRLTSQVTSKIWRCILLPRTVRPRHCCQVLGPKVSRYQVSNLVRQRSGGTDREFGPYTGSVHAALFQQLWFTTARFDLELHVLHIPGIHNVFADCLSRWDMDDSYPR